MKRQTKEYFFVLKELVGREIKRKYARSYLGILWSVLNPLLSMAVLSLIFSYIFSRSIENFPIYYLTGYVLWLLFAEATRSAMTVLVDNKQLLIKVRMPKQVLTLSRIFTALANFLYSLIAFALMLAVFRMAPSVHIVAFPVIVALMMLFCIGVGYILSIVYVFFGDVKHLYSVILTLWMYMSALFYPVDILPEYVQRIININPIYSYVESARECIMYHHFPSGMMWLEMAAWGFGIFLLGLYVFRKNENKIMQRL